MTQGWRTVIEAKDITPEILKAAEGIFDGWYADERIDWTDFLDRLDGMPLNDGTKLDLGNDMMSPACQTIKKHIRKYQKEEI